MGTRQVWKRLWWKEFRESWLAVTVAVVAPPFLLSLGTVFMRYDGVIQFFASCGALTLIAVWAAGKASRERQSSEFARTHLPVTQIKEWVVACLSPTIMTYFIGAWYAVCHTAAARWPLSPLVVWLPLATSGIFAMCYLLSRAISSWFSIAAGVIASVFTYVFIVRYSFICNDLGVGMSIYEPMVRFVALCLAGALVGSLLFAILSTRTSLRVVRVVALGAALAIVIGPHVGSIVNSLWGPNSNYSVPYSTSVSSPDRSLVVTAQFGIRAYPRDEGVWFHDYRRDLRVQLDKTEGILWPIGILDENTAALARQSPGEKAVAVLVWNVRSGKLRKLAEIPAGRDALLRSVMRYAYRYGDVSAFSLSPGGEHALLDLGAMRGIGSDLWLVDLRTGRSRIVLPNRSRYADEQVDWRDGQVTISRRGTAFNADLDNVRTAKIEIPRKAGGGQ